LFQELVFENGFLQGGGKWEMAVGNSGKIALGAEFILTTLLSGCAVIQFSYRVV